MRFTSLITVVCIICFSAWSADKVSFSGYLDSDVWTDLEGNFFTNDELDLGMSIMLSEKVSANVYATVLNGSIPAGGGEPGGRWSALYFDGVDLSFETGFGSVAVGDLVYQYGGFNYYFYKRVSMITPESFTRGAQVTFGGDGWSQSILAGAADDADELVSYNVPAAGADTIEITGTEILSGGNAADIGGVTEISLAGDAALALYYGIRGDVAKAFDDGGYLYAGAEYSGTLSESFEIKTDVGYTSLGTGTERVSTVALLVEPTLTLGKYSAAASVYYFIDPDSSGTSPIDDEFFAYVEPGISLSDKFALGLPLEIHSADAEDIAGAGAFWAVPTMYVYPADNAQWWLWAQVVAPFGEDSDLAYGLGSEIIVEF